MPKIKIPVHSNTYENDCEKVKSMADEYLHDELIVLNNFKTPRELELSEDERSFVDGHIKECAGCLNFIESESIYIENMAQAEYVPEASVWDFVADKISKDKITIEKPKKKIFVPFGLISAAAVVIIVFIASKSGLPGVFMKSTNKADSNIWESAEREDEKAAIFAAADMDAEDSYSNKEEYAGGSETNEAQKAEDYLFIEEAVPEAAAMAPSPAKDVFTDSLFWETNFDLAVEWLYRLDLGGGEAGEILKDIEIYRADPEGRFYIIGLQYGDLLKRNIVEAGIYADADSAYNPNAKETDEKYIGILCY